MPSSANFLIFELPKTADPNQFLDRMYDQKVSIKVMHFWNRNWCRVSIGTKKNMETFLYAFDNHKE